MNDEQFEEEMCALEDCGHEDFVEALRARDTAQRKEIAELRAALATQPSSIKLPPPQEYMHGPWALFHNYAAASWNQCLDAVQKLNAVRGAEHDQ